MIRFFLTAGLVLMLSAPSLIAGDLYLVKIENSDQLNSIKEMAGHAHGVVNGRFLVELDRDQVQRLSISGVSPELVMSNYAGEKIYLIAPERQRDLVPPKGISFLYSAGNNHLAHLESDQPARLRADGFVVTTLSDKETPFFLESSFLPAPSLTSYPCDTLADLVSMDSISSYIHRLQAFRSRCVYSDSIDAAGEWLESKFHEFGYSLVYPDWFTGTDQFSGGTVTAFNVVCIKPGTTYPNKYIVIGAHYDSYQWYPQDYYHAPGADDNASGTAAVLELARVLKNFDCDYTLIFSPFSAEEVGLLGSGFMAHKMHTNNDSIRFMLNFDMIAHNLNILDSVLVRSSVNHAYGKVFSEASKRVSTMVPYWATAASPSTDEYSFYQQGYPTASMIEWDFNPRIHYPHDSTVYLDFSYAEEVVRTCAASLGIINRALDPVYVKIIDVGDGQSLRFEIINCLPDYSYNIFFGPAPGGSSGGYADTAVIGPGICHFDAAGLIPGQKYYAAAMVISQEGYSSIELKEDTLTPRIVPRSPQLISINPDSMRITVVWKANAELDINHYRLLRRVSVGDWEAVADGITDTVFTDFDVIGHETHSYAVLAFDNDFNMSDTSQVLAGIPATFDWPLLFVDETNAGGINPTETMQSEFYNGMLAGLTFTKVRVDSLKELPKRSDLGQYKTVFWIDDDNANHYFGSEVSAADWYLGYAANMLLAGWKTVYSVTGASYLYPGNFFNDHMGLSRVEMNSMPNFIGADGATGWPDLELKQGEPFYGQMSDITVFQKTSNSEVIYSFRSNVPGGYFDGKPVGIAYNTGFGKRVVLGFPLYYLTEASAQALVQKVLAYFVEPTPHYGDVNHDGRVNIQDITFLINYLYKGGPAPSALNDADANGDCSINIRDITYLIKYLYQSGPAPVVGCVE
jgi:Zn-dependent M28 family amino/carboxypeptidase